MTSAYREGLDAMRRQLRTRLGRLVEREAALPRAQRGELRDLRPSLAAPLEDLDDVSRADAALGAYERRLDVFERRAEEQRAERERLRPVRRAIRILSLLLVVVGAFLLLGFRRQRELREAARLAHESACRATRGCVETGRCSVEWSSDGRALGCVTRSHEECAASVGCRLVGACTATEGRCVADSDADCATAAICRRHGRCTARDEGCTFDALSQAEVWSRDVCLDQPACIYHARCGSDGSGGCVVRSSADCARSHACDHDGLCRLEGDRCVADDAGCFLSRACQQQGRCRAAGGRCAAAG